MGLVGACDIASPGRQHLRADRGPDRRGAVDHLADAAAQDDRAGRGRYYLTGEKFGAAEAAEIGLITLAAERRRRRGRRRWSPTLGKASPQGLAASKALTTAAVLAGFDRDAERLSAESARLFVSDEAREGMLAFLQKRPPRWAAARQRRS